MSTTAVIIEHLISGLQAILWVFLLVLAVFGYEWVPLEQVKSISPEVTVVAFAIVYPIGIFFDEVADRVFHPWTNKIRQSRLQREGLKAEDGDITAFYLLQRTDDEFLRSYFNYIRMRIRISRSAAFNFGLTTFLAVVFTSLRLSVGWKVIAMELFLGSSLTLLAVFAWYRFSDTFVKQIARVWKSRPT